jgi:hypothetical protein
MTFRMKARRAGWLLVVAAFAFGIVSAIRPAPTQAYGLISSRFVKLSSSEASGAGGLGGGTNVIYSFGYTVATTASVGSMVVRFCGNNPIIGDSCTAPTGFDDNKATLSINNRVGVTDWTLQTGVSTANELLFTRPAATSLTGGSTTVTFDLGNGSTNGITNPSVTNTSFFVRIMLFSSTATSPLPGVAGDPAASNAGGVALSTANVLNVTAKVQETLVFCVYSGVNCAAGGTDYALGDSNGVLAATNTSYLNANGKFDLASNALGGIVVRLKGDTLTSGSFTISPNGDSCTPDSSTTSVEQFGIRVVSYGTSQSAFAAGRYDCLANNHMFSPTVTNTTYGDPFVKTTGASDVSTTNFELEAKAASTTEAGVYNTKLMLIATATY